MKVSFDLLPLLSMFVPGRLSVRSWEIAGSLDAPFAVSPATRLHIENQLIRESRSGNTLARAGLKRWLTLWNEGVFFEDRTDFTLAFALARAWNTLPTLPPPAAELVQPALAVAGRCTHFVSFTPFSRNRAIESGIKVLPARLP